MSDAEATVRGALLGALANTAHETGLVAGPPTERLVDELVAALRAPETAWATRELFA